MDLFPGHEGFYQLVENWPRAVPSRDLAFSVIHITGNYRLPSAAGEVGWRVNDPALQNSATFFVDRDGGIWQALGDPLRMAPWANGDVSSPDLGNPRISAVVRDNVNANMRTILAIENVGFEGVRPDGTRLSAPITAAQVAANARLIRYYHAKAGVPVNRQTVIGHYQLNSTGRANCPGIDRSVVDRIVAQAAPENNMILVPIETFPAGTTVYFPKGQTYELYRIVGGRLERSTITTPADRGTAALAGARMALDGDTARAGILILNGGKAGWIVSGYNAVMPRINRPDPDAALAAAKATITSLEGRISRARMQAQETVAALAA